MRRRIAGNVQLVLIMAALVICLGAAWTVLKQGSPAFGGNFSPQMAPPGDHYQIAGCDSNSAWIIDTTSGDVYLIYANGRWKDVGSINDEKKHIKK